MITNIAIKNHIIVEAQLLAHLLEEEPLVEVQHPELEAEVNQANQAANQPISQAANQPVSRAAPGSPARILI
eukprot:3289800-Lingulodinium_polyedra.AAC.1